MDDFETVLPKLAAIPLFADFDIKKEDDLKILKNVYEIISIKKFKKSQFIFFSVVKILETCYKYFYI